MNFFHLASPLHVKRAASYRAAPACRPSRYRIAVPTIVTHCDEQPTPPDPCRRGDVGVELCAPRERDVIASPQTSAIARFEHTSVIAGAKRIGGEWHEQ